jgi:hypothetical protein
MKLMMFFIMVKDQVEQAELQPRLRLLLASVRM